MSQTHPRGPTLAEAGMDPARVENMLDSLRGVLLVVDAPAEEAITAATLLVGDILGGLRLTDEAIAARCERIPLLITDRARQVRTNLATQPPTTATPQ